MQLTSSAFEARAAIPTKFTCAGDDISPELSWRVFRKEQSHLF
jgi:phosphatidylethanolamine-binding protein (PEBP) family uncharacterized protein